MRNDPVSSKSGASSGDAGISSSKAGVTTVLSHRNRGLYQIVDPNGQVVLGRDFDASLDSAETARRGTTEPSSSYPRDRRAMTPSPSTASSNVIALVASKAAGALALMRSITDWRPEPGDELAGEIVGMRPRIGPYGEGKQLLVKTAEGKTYAVWVTPWIGDQLRAYKAETGDGFGIVFLGKETSRSGARYNSYELVVERAAR